MSDPTSGTSRARMLSALALLWLTGTALRLTILAVPPVIPLIHDDLNLNATQIGVLTGLPSIMLALAAVPGSLLIARLGVTRRHDRRAGADRARRRAARRDARHLLALCHDRRSWAPASPSCR